MLLFEGKDPMNQMSTEQERQISEQLGVPFRIDSNSDLQNKEFVQNHFKHLNMLKDSQRTQRL